VVLIVVAALGLIVWWIRNARHGRRARQLVDSTGEIRLPGRLPGQEPPGQEPPAASALPEAPPAPAVPAAPAVQDAPNGHRFDLPPSPSPGASPGDAVDSPDAEPVVTWLDDDPVIAEFFASPPPEYGGQPDVAGHASPSGRRRGPNS
jgi:hypothetical protein